MKESEEKYGSFFKGLLLGTLAGVGIFYFLNTKEGEKIKKKIKKHGEEALGNLSEIIVDLEGKGEEFKKKAQGLQTELERRLKGQDSRVSSKAKDDLSQIEKLRERGRRAVKLFTRQGKPLKKKSSSS